MDPYAQKRDNRKKFQDKEKLKRRHATPSDRKYRALNKTTEPELEVPELQANHYRYHEDLSMTYQQDEDFDAKETNRKLKQVLQTRKNNTSIDDSHSRPGHVTRRDLDSMSVSDLNQLLGQRKDSNSVQIADTEEIVSEKPDRLEPKREIAGKRKEPNQSRSTIPVDLETDQDLLDELI
ncbi:LAME_0H19922g1_1 [Lachancea meyersii CBS 8951]|uniref:LAME_0H19922g1_1 n=1 Tax=Lachancea meyersii CBS 8951 TaxID=1266667 RepID=A0A1G4KJJ2_9SACH|nr:LAME_0H19922g1_1 [Lachancea meyersii CBS 8951]